jgi:hypothetical protein
MFKVTGVSRNNGVFKVRFANDMSRVKVLMKTGNDEIELLELPTEMSKGDCVKHLKGTDMYQRAEFKEAIDTADAKYNGAANGAATVKVTAPKAKAKAPSLEAIKARAAKAPAVDTKVATTA